MKLRFCLMVLCCVGLTNTFGQQTCFTDLKDKGDIEAKGRKWNKAIKFYQAAKHCDTLSYLRIRSLDSLINAMYKRWLDELDNAQKQAKKEKEQSNTEQKNSQLFSAYNALIRARDYIEKGDFKNAYEILQFARQQNLQKVNSLISVVSPYVPDSIINFESYRTFTINNRNYIAVIHKEHTSRLRSASEFEEQEQPSSREIPYKISILELTAGDIKEVFTRDFTAGIDPYFMLYDNYLVSITRSRFYSIDLTKLHTSPDSAYYVSENRTVTTLTKSDLFVSRDTTYHDEVKTDYYTLSIKSFPIGTKVFSIDSVVYYRYFENSQKLAVYQKQNGDAVSFLLFKVSKTSCKLLDRVNNVSHPLQVSTTTRFPLYKGTLTSNDLVFLKISGDSTRTLFYDIDTEILADYTVKLFPYRSDRKYYVKCMLSRAGMLLLNRYTRILTFFDNNKKVKAEIPNVTDYLYDPGDNKVALYRRGTKDSLIVFSIDKRDTSSYVYARILIVNDTLVSAFSKTSIKFISFPNLRTVATINTDLSWDYSFAFDKKYLILNSQSDEEDTTASSRQISQTIIYSVRSNKILAQINHNRIIAQNSISNIFVCSSSNPDEAVVYYIDTTQDMVDSSIIKHGKTDSVEYDVTYFDMKTKKLFLSYLEGENESRSWERASSQSNTEGFPIQFPMANTIHLYDLVSDRYDTIKTSLELSEGLFDVIGDYLILYGSVDIEGEETFETSAFFYNMRIDKEGRLKKYNNKHSENTSDIKYIKKVFGVQ